MSTYTNADKSPAATVSNFDKNVSTYSGMTKGGQSWAYGEAGYTYGILSVQDLGVVYYGQVGVSQAVTNLDKN